MAIAAGALSHLRQPKADAPAKDPEAVSKATEVSLPGRIEAQHTVEVAAAVEGTIARFEAEVGQEVFQGQLLAQITNGGLQTEQTNASSDVERAQIRTNNLESSLIQARLEASRAGADASRAKSDTERLEKIYLRQKLLVQEGATPRLVFEKAERDYKAAEAEAASLTEIAKQAEDRIATLSAEIDTARRQLDAKNEELERVRAEVAACEVHAPVTGVIVARRGQVGDDVDTTTNDLFRIAVDLSELKIVVEPRPLELKRMRPGLNAIIRVTENGNEPLPGLVREIKGNQVLVEFQNPNPAIRPGLTAQVQIKLT